ncbi:MAG: hypothetical protein ACLVE4_10700 [Longicatena caecimuris]|uniref:hypothetical protein n=1 Tax=Longicatena caecimuris TaxID=1796635 RepID=UPI003999BA5F
MKKNVDYLTEGERSTLLRFAYTTIGTNGARNCFMSYKNGQACGKSHCKKPKGTLLHVRNVKDLK